MRYFVSKMISGKYSECIREEARRLGFFSCGFAKAARLDEDAVRLEKWLNLQHHGSMHYMADHFDKRVDPRLLVPGAKSVITLLLNYYPAESQVNRAPLISKYAFGKDYHLVIKEKLRTLLNFIRTNIGEVDGRGFVDSAPVLERSWALKSGAGWIGKNGNLISKQHGSFFFIATLIVDLELEYDAPFVKDYCGTCTKCIDACPTGAILPDKEINGSQCVSYFTIELKDALIESDKKWDDWIFGCDICQDVCPWNRFSSPAAVEDFKPNSFILEAGWPDWLELTEDIFKERFRESPLARSKFKGIVRNLHHLLKQKEPDHSRD